MCRQTVRLFALLLTVISLAPINADSLTGDPAARITVIFKNGRRAKATIDSRTDDNRLWLQFGADSARVTRAIWWDEVSLFQTTGQPLSRGEVLSLAQRAAPTQTTGNSQSLIRRTIGDSSGRMSTEREVNEGQRTNLTRFVRFDATIGNWDDDVETDGLMVQVSPYSASGTETSIRGELQVELWAMRRVEQDSVPRGRGRSFEILQRWSVPIAVEARNSPGWVKLPFQARHPEFDVSWSSIGLVHLELVAPGHGVFHHSVDAIRIRPYAPIRDALQVHTGERFLPTELNGRK